MRNARKYRCAGSYSTWTIGRGISGERTYHRTCLKFFLRRLDCENETKKERQNTLILLFLGQMSAILMRLEIFKGDTRQSQYTRGSGR